MSRNPGRIKPLEKVDHLKKCLRKYTLEEHSVGDPGYVWLTDNATCVTVVNPNPNPAPDKYETLNLNITLGKTGMTLAFADLQMAFHNARDHFSLLEELSVGIVEDKFCCGVLMRNGKPVVQKLVVTEKAAANPESVFTSDPAAVTALDNGGCTAVFTHWNGMETIPLLS